jgi:myo-inositol-1(or 4)-monophosphatase
MTEEYQKLMEVCISSALAAGDVLTSQYGDPTRNQIKESCRDVATNVDVDAEESAFMVIRKFDSQASILSEEHGFLGNENDREFWIVDALDGTVNYLQQIPLFCVSIASFVAGEVVAGCVYAPMTEELYYGAKGLGAFKNKSKLSVQNARSDSSLFAVAFSGKNFDPTRRVAEFEAFMRVNDSSRGCLRTGSAALNLAFLAENRFNGCWGKANKVWDVAAGLLLAEESGAIVQRMSSPDNPELLSYIAAPEGNFEFLKNYTSNIF